MIQPVAHPTFIARIRRALDERSFVSDPEAAREAAEVRLTSEEISERRRLRAGVGFVGNEHRS